ncbi:hypothetical protein [Desulfuromonas sp. TF]|uniref:hypothetical protein n=1 Tax=Desulfuromonas sp. TF TaxID=1232410 RepID=UPI0004816391|nr:hypothetical protein [Desulfuromonas sp. TF]
MTQGILINLVSWIITLGLTAISWNLLSHIRKLKKESIDKELHLETIGLLKTFASREEAVSDQLSKIMKAKEIKFLAYNGFALLDTPSYLDSAMYKIVSGWNNGDNKKIEILILNPSCLKAIVNRITRINRVNLDPNESEVNEHIKDILRNYDTFRRIKDMNDNVDIQIKFFDSDLLWCILAYEDSIILSFYQDGTTAKNARTILIDKGSLLGRSFVNYFDYLWEEGNRKLSQIPKLKIEEVQDNEDNIFSGQKGSYPTN